MRRGVSAAKYYAEFVGYPLMLLNSVQDLIKCKKSARQLSSFLKKLCSYIEKIYFSKFIFNCGPVKKSRIRCQKCHLKKSIQAGFWSQGGRKAVLQLFLLPSPEPLIPKNAPKVKITKFVHFFMSKIVDFWILYIFP